MGNAVNRVVSREPEIRYDEDVTLVSVFGKPEDILWFDVPVPSGVAFFVARVVSQRPAATFLYLHRGQAMDAPDGLCDAKALVRQPCHSFRARVRRVLLPELGQVHVGPLKEEIVLFSMRVGQEELDQVLLPPCLYAGLLQGGELVPIML